MSSFERHKAKAPKTLNFALIVCSSSRFEAYRSGRRFEDLSGDLAESLIEAWGFKVSHRMLLPDDLKTIREAVDRLCSMDDVDVVLISGGTGLSPRDVTVEAVRPMFEKEIPGFGELFRMLTFQREGSIAVLSRAVAGVYRGKIVFAIPGSPGAVELALKRLILPEAAHMVLHAKGLG